jgi:hypothetical protein
MRFVLAAGIALMAIPMPVFSQKVNADSALIQDFENRVKDYLKLQQQVDAALTALKPTVSSGAISRHEHELAEGIRKARAGAVQGSIFTPQIAAEFRRLITITMQGADARHIRESLEHAEPVSLSLRVGDPWPPGVPLQSTPPTLLMNLPPLDKGLEYRVLADSLALHDTRANLIVDFVPNAIH